MGKYSDLLFEARLAASGSPELLIVERIKDLICRNVLSAGDRLPSLRTVKEQWKVPERSVRKAYDMLEKEGLIRIFSNYGAFVNDQFKAGRKIYHWPEYVVLPAGLQTAPGTNGREMTVSTISVGFENLAPKLFNIRDFTGYIQVALNDYGSADSAGIQAAISKELSKYLKMWGILASDEQCTYVPYKDALRMAVSLLLMPGDVIAMDSPEDIEALRVFVDAGLQSEFTGADRNGMLTSALEAQCMSGRVKAVFVRPAGARPKNAMLSGKRREELIRIAVKYNVFIIANDDDHELWLGKPVLP